MARRRRESACQRSRQVSGSGTAMERKEQRGTRKGKSAAKRVSGIEEGARAERAPSPREGGKEGQGGEGEGWLVTSLQSEPASYVSVQSIVDVEGERSIDM